MHIPDRVYITSNHKLQTWDIGREVEDSNLCLILVKWIQEELLCFHCLMQCLYIFVSSDIIFNVLTDGDIDYKCAVAE